MYSRVVRSAAVIAAAVGVGLWLVDCVFGFCAASTTGAATSTAARRREEIPVKRVPVRGGLRRWNRTNDSPFVRAAPRPRCTMLFPASLPPIAALNPTVELRDVPPALRHPPPTRDSPKLYAHRDSGRSRRP